MSDIEFSLKNRVRTITIKVSEDDKALYDLLAREYAVSMNREMHKAIVKHLNFLKDQVIRQKPKAS